MAADGRLFLTVALALLALPSAVAQYAVPGAGIGRSPQSGGEIVLMVVVWVVGLVGQLALVRLAIGPSVSVGEAILHGGRRTPAYFAAVVLIILAIMLLSLPFVVLLTMLGITMEPGAAPPPAALIVLLLFVAVISYVAIRMLLTSPVASAEAVGPIGIIKRSWVLTSGHGWRLFGFLILFIIGAIIAIAAASVAATLLMSLLVGQVEPLSVSALVIALVEALASAIATMLFILMLARIYVQLTTGSGPQATVPKSGT